MNDQNTKQIVRGVMILVQAVVLSSLVSCARTSRVEQTSDTDSSATVMVEHAMGSTAVPEQPERVVVIDTAALDASLALGVKPLGSVIYETFPGYLGEQTEGIAYVGEGTAPNLEKILQLNPDLILGSKISSGKIYNRLSQIAPTVLTEGSGRSGDWRENLLLIAEALGRSDKAEIILEDYQRRVDKIGQTLDDVENTVISVIVGSQGRIGFYSANSFSGSVLRDVGFSRPLAQEKPKRWAVLVSRENLDSLDGDIIFLIEFPGSLSKEEFVSDPVLSRLEAVQRDHVYSVDRQVWIVGRNILAAHAILDDITEIFADIEGTKR